MLLFNEVDVILRSMYGYLNRKKVRTIRASRMFLERSSLLDNKAPVQEPEIPALVRLAE
jgi:hypothetical protein